MIDTHTHYFLKDFDADRYMILEKLKENGITRVIEVAIGMESNFNMRKLFTDTDMVYFGAGIHPLRVAFAEGIYGLEGSRAILRELIRTPKTVAVGETGLDYHRCVACEEDKELQKRYFKMQLELALEFDMPLILHIRDCHDDALEILEGCGKQFKGVCHCFIGSAETAARYTALGFYLGIGGSATYSQNKGRFEEFIRDLPLLPLDRIVLETDAPYLIPSGCKGKRNTSLNLPSVVKVLAQAMALSEEEITAAADRNAMACFFAKNGAPSPDELKDRIRGMLIGGAAGDALGYEIEFLNERTIFAKFGKSGITSYEYSMPHHKAIISDDTQMTLFTAGGLIDRLTNAESDPVKAIHTAYQEWLMTQEMTYRESADYYHTFGDRYSATALLENPLLFARRAPGITCLSALSKRGAMEEAGAYDPLSPINNSKGCGGVMRVAPVGALKADIAAVDKLGADAAAITHSHSLGWLPGAMLAHIINRILYPLPQLDTLKAIVEDARDAVAEIFGGDGHIASLTALIDKAITLSENGGDDLDNIHALGEGWVGDEALAIALYCSLKYHDDFSQGIIAAVNHKGDSDSTGAIAGNILGAWLGYEKIERKWKEDLELSAAILQIADKLTHCVTA